MMEFQKKASIMHTKNNVSPENAKELKIVYVRSVANALGTGMINPFVGPYAVKELGASSSHMGWFQSMSNISNNVMQVLWGRLSDRIGR